MGCGEYLGFSFIYTFSFSLAHRTFRTSMYVWLSLLFYILDGYSMN